MEEGAFLECMSLDFPNLQLTRNDLLHPTASMLRRYYVTMLEQIMRMTPEEIYGFNSEQLDFFRGGGGDIVMEDHVSSSNLYRAVKYIFDNIESFRSDDFHFSDILFPYLSPKRAFIFMSTMYAFYVTCAEFDACYDQMDTCEEKQQKMSELKQEIARLKEQLTINKERKTKFVNEFKEINSELLKLAATCKEDQLELQELHCTEREQAEKLLNLEVQEAKIQEELSKIENEKKYYESLIVSDGSSMSEQLSKLKIKREERLYQLQKLEHQRRDGLANKSTLERVLGLQEMLNTELRAPILVNAEPLDIKELNLMLCELKKKQSVLDREETEVASIVKDKEGILPGRKKEVHIVETEGDSIMCTWEEKLSRYKTLMEGLRRSLADTRSLLKNDEARVEETRQKIKQVENILVQGEAELRNDFKKHNEQFTKVDQLMKQKFQSVKLKAAEYKALE